MRRCVLSWHHERRVPTLRHQWQPLAAFSLNLRADSHHKGLFHNAYTVESVKYRGEPLSDTMLYATLSA